MPPTTVLRCGVLYDGRGHKPQVDAGLVLDGPRIASVEPWDANLTDLASRLPYHDLRGCTVIPGLIDGHAHLCAGAPDSVAAEPVDQVGTVAWGLAAASAALLAGVTTIVDVGSPAGLALRVAQLIKDGVASGPRVMAAGAAITTTAGHCAEWLGIPADNAAQLVVAVRREVANGADLIKIMVTGGSMDPISNRRRAQYSSHELQCAIDDAHRLGKIVVGHANATEGITRAVNAGIDIIAHCNWLGTEPRTVTVDWDTVNVMVERSVWIDLNIDGATRSLKETDGDIQGDWTGPEPNTRWDLLEPLRERGVRLYLTSDGFGPMVGLFTRSLNDWQTRWEIQPEVMISLVSSEPAEALGLSDIGALLPGKRADFVVLPGDLRDDPSALLAPDAVYRAGTEVVRKGRLAAAAIALNPGDVQTVPADEFR